MVGYHGDKCDVCVEYFLQLKLKVKSQRLLSNTTLAVHTLDLYTLGLLGQQSHNNEEQTLKWYGGY